MTENENPQTTDDDVSGHKHSLDGAPGVHPRQDGAPGVHPRQAVDDDEDDVAGHKHSLDGAPGISGAVSPGDDVRS